MLHNLIVHGAIDCRWSRVAPGQSDTDANWPFQWKIKIIKMNEKKNYKSEEKISHKLE